MTNNQQLKTKKKGQGGFTLLETLVAISILMIAIAGPLTLVAQTLQASYYARDQITASYLAQDAMEYIRNIRDASRLESADSETGWKGFLDKFSGCTNADDPCGIDTISGSIIASCKNDDCILHYSDPQGENGGTGSYSSSGGVLSRFTRSFYVQKVAGNDHEEENIFVTVKWTGNNLTSSANNAVTLKETLENWQ